VSRIVVLKIGGELLESRDDAAALARVITRAARQVPLAVVHGGGKEIDAALAHASIPKRQVDGLRVTDAATLDVVVAVLAGTVNTRLVATLAAAGTRAVGLTAADAGVLLVRAARPHRSTSGALVDLGLVGEPARGEGAPLVSLLCRKGFTPVIASIGADRKGQLFNVNADTLAAHLAARARAARLVVAGGTAGVLDADGGTIARLDDRAITRLVASGTATAGMVAKLRACSLARQNGVREVTIANGRSKELHALITGKAPRSGAWTRLA
jgi:acetylglutamate kinase